MAKERNIKIKFVKKRNRKNFIICNYWMIPELNDFVHINEDFEGRVCDVEHHISQNDFDVYVVLK